MASRSPPLDVRSDELPPLLYVADLARFLGRTPKAVRMAVGRGLLPAPVRVAGRLAWRGEDVRLWLSEIRGAQERPHMQITATRYTYQGRKAPSPAQRFQVTFLIPHPTRGELRTRRITPPELVLDQQGALAWGRAQEREIYAELLGQEPKETTNPVQIQPTRSTPAPATPSTVPTLAAFFERFEAQYLRHKKPATIASYMSIWRHYLKPKLGTTPLDLIGHDQLTELYAAIGALSATSRNQVLHKLRRMLDKACMWRVLREDRVPRIRTEPEDKKPDPVVYSDEQIDMMIDTARKGGEDNDDPLELVAIVLLATHGALRVSEVCALRWGDVDFARKLIHVRHNYSRGIEASPKGGKEAPIGMSKELSAALQALPRKGAHVVSKLWRGEEIPHTPHTITARLQKLQDRCGLPRSGLHLLRHTGLTALARRGTSPWNVQAQARHARVSTTMRYVHLAAETAVQECASAWDDKPAKKQPKKAKTSKKPPTATN